MANSHFHGVSRTETPVARPPSPPYIHIPTPADTPDNAITLHPITTLSPTAATFNLGLPTPATRADVLAITRGGAPQTAPHAQLWTYESRRLAQPVLSYLYLGPASLARDHAYLRAEGITLLLAARDARQAAARLLAVADSARELGIAAEYVDVSGRQELISAIPVAVGRINAHLLEKGGRGRVLVCCETGNERSAALVAAYIMTMYDADMVRTLQFIHHRRFCANFDDDLKFLLRGYGDIIAARRMMPEGPRQQPQEENQRSLAPVVGMKAKRGIGESSTDDDESLGEGPESDLQRFDGRHLTPFVDGGDEAMGMEG